MRLKYSCSIFFPPLKKIQKYKTLKCFIIKAGFISLNINGTTTKTDRRDAAKDLTSVLHGSLFKKCSDQSRSDRMCEHVPVVAHGPFGAALTVWALYVQPMGMGDTRLFQFDTFCINFV